VALAATIYTFDIELSDVDRNVYETLSVRVARHPSEAEDYLLARVLAYCEQLELYALDRTLLTALVARLARRMVFALSVTDRHLY